MTGVQTCALPISIQTLPYADGTSGVQNFNYLASNIDTRQSLAAFRELVSFEHLALFVNAELARAVPGFTAQTKAAAQLPRRELDVIPGGPPAGGGANEGGGGALLFFLMMRRPHGSTLCPYPTLFRSNESEPSFADSIEENVPIS